MSLFTEEPHSEFLRCPVQLLFAFGTFWTQLVLLLPLSQGPALVLFLTLVP